MPLNILKTAKHCLNSTNKHEKIARKNFYKSKARTRIGITVACPFFVYFPHLYLSFRYVIITIIHCTLLKTPIAEKEVIHI